MVKWFVPWEFDPAAVLGLAVAVAAYALGLARGARPAYWRRVLYGLGVLSMYAVMHTRLDYFAQYLFSAHRAQHLVLYHLGPFLIALSDPLPVWRRAPGAAVQAPRSAVRVYRCLQQPAVAGLLFVGLIAFWLIPSVHFDAMLSRDLYLLMNWSMAIDGLLFWWLMLAPRGGGHLVDPGYGTRIVVLVAVMFPQIAIGAFIALGPSDLYDVYAVCGRAFPLSPAQDQLYGGLITWIPAAMMSVVGALTLLRRWRREEAGPVGGGRERLPQESGRENG